MSTPAIVARYSGLFSRLESMTLYVSFSAVALVVLWRMVVADAQVDWDEEAYLQISRFWRQGLIPYRDIFDIKPPTIFVFYMLTSFGDGMFWTRTIVTVLLVGSTLQMFRAVQLRGWINSQQIPFLAAALCCVISIGKGVGTNLEQVYIPFEVFAFSFLLGRKPWLSGMCAGMVIAVKYTAVADIVGLGLTYWILLKEGEERIRCLKVCGCAALAFSLVTYGVYYVYFALHGVNLLQAIVLRNLVHAGSASVGIFSQESYLIPVTVLIAKITTPIVLLSGFRVKKRRLLFAAVPWLVLSLCQALITRQYYYHYFLPVFVPLSLVWASLRVDGLPLAILAPCLLGLEASQALNAVRWNEAYRSTVAQYRNVCHAINDRGYVMSMFVAAYRVCNSPRVDKFMFPSFYLEEHFVLVSQSGGMEAFREKLDKRELKTVISTSGFWPDLAPMLKNERSRVKLVQDPMESFPMESFIFWHCCGASQEQ